MKKITAFTTCISALLLAHSTAHAGTNDTSAFTTPENNSFYGGIGHGTTRSDISNRNDSETRLFLKGHAGFTVNNYLGIEAGGLWFDDIEIDGRDSVSEYEVNLERYDIYLGPTFQFKPHWFIPIRLTAGATYSRVSMEVRESFYNLAPSGKTGVKDHVTGTYLSLGIVPFQQKYISGLISIDSIKRQDFFDESTRPLSIKDTAISFRLSFY